jgi:hypothetical protein
MSLCAFLLFAALMQASGIDRPQPYRAARASSGAADGSNADSVRVAPKSAHTVAEIQGAGRIAHMWFTLASPAPDYLSTTRLEIFWDGSDKPSVDAPFGAFHLLGHNHVRQVNSALVTVEARPDLNHNLPNKNVGGFNSYFPMPYARGARIVLENGSAEPLTVYYQIDYQQWPSAPSPLRFFAVHRATAPEKYPGPQAGQRDARNPDGRDNHVILAAEGRGHYLGVSLSVDASGAGWWEGDEMIWIDGEKRPSILGTGTEDYFGGAWGFRREYTMPFHGVSYLEKVPDRADWQAGRYTVYRWHEKDPIPFTKGIRVSIERGHNNHRRDSGYRSVAYYYLSR